MFDSVLVVAWRFPLSSW